MNALATAIDRSTSHQRLYIRTLMAQLELPTKRFSFQHRVPFRVARLPEPPEGQEVDPHLCALSKSQASALITALKDQLGEDDEDEDESDDD